MAISNLVKQGGGTNLHEYTPFLSRNGSTSGATYVTAFSVTGKGILNQITSDYGNTAIIHAKVTIDGVVVASDVVLTVGGYTPMSRLTNIPFSTSLKVEIKKSISTGQYVEIEYLLA